MDPPSPSDEEGRPQVEDDRSYAIDRLPWPEVGRRIEADPRLIVPVGALEQHGPHLPVGTNIIVSRQVALEVSRRTGILLAPTFSYGVTVGGGPYPGRAGVRRKTLHRVMNELIQMWEEDGFVDFAIITAHRFEPHLEALLMTVTGSSETSVFDLYQIDVSDIIASDPEAEHAGELETSLMLHLAPDLVHLERAIDFLPRGDALRKYTRRRVPKPPEDSRGVIGAPSLATPGKGHRVFLRYVEKISHAIAGT
ncbi:MAG: creatininase family protein [Longimicrobiales bacterium]|nr:creatininase family protein [Longimicrobiales bacterium]